MSEIMLVNHCAPTLAGMKSGSLFSCEQQGAERAVSRWNRLLNGRGVYVRRILFPGRRSLIYVYRPDQLRRDLMDPLARPILQKCGYCGKCPEKMLDTLQRRLQHTGQLPHEIGLFLGYPPEDVAGFMEHGGQNFRMKGLWKVYGDEARARHLFARYRRCTDVYRRKMEEGTSLLRLTVAS